MNRIRPVVLALAALAAAAGPAAAADVSVQQAWARATTPDAKSGVVYLSLKSEGGDTLLGVSTPVAKEAGLHVSYRSGDVSGMRPIDKLPLPAGKTVVLAPGGFHVMLMGLSHRLEPGTSFALTLSLAKGGTLETKVQVEAPGAGGPPQADHDMGSMPGMSH